MSHHKFSVSEKLPTETYYRDSQYPLKMSILGEFLFFFKIYSCCCEQKAYGCDFRFSFDVASSSDSPPTSMKHRSRSVVKSASALGLSLMISSGKADITVQSVRRLFQFILNLLQKKQLHKQLQVISVITTFNLQLERVAADRAQRVQETRLHAENCRH